MALSAVLAITTLDSATCHQSLRQSGFPPARRTLLVWPPTGTPLFGDAQSTHSRRSFCILMAGNARLVVYHEVTSIVASLLVALQPFL